MGWESCDERGSCLTLCGDEAGGGLASGLDRAGGQAGGAERSSNGNHCGVGAGEGSGDELEMGLRCNGWL